jgi:hypothetical protein
VDWCTRNFHFELLKHEVLECETFIISMFGGVHDHTCHTFEKKHEDKCMQNQQNKDIGGTQKPKCWKSLFIGAKAFMHVIKKGDAFLIYVLPMLDAKSSHHEIPS